MSALAIAYTSSSLPEPFMQFTAWRMKRLFSGMYPKPGLILSMVHENGCGPLPDGFLTKANPVSSQHPVQRVAHHASVKENGRPRFFASICRDLKM